MTINNTVSSENHNNASDVIATVVASGDNLDNLSQGFANIWLLVSIAK